MAGEQEDRDSLGTLTDEPDESQSVNGGENTEEALNVKHQGSSDCVFERSKPSEKVEPNRPVSSALQKNSEPTLGENKTALGYQWLPSQCTFSLRFRQGPQQGLIEVQTIR